jgi:hypothetical protein
MIDTSADMIAGYVVATAIYVGYVASLWMRARRLRVILSEAKNPSA